MIAQRFLCITLILFIFSSAAGAAGAPIRADRAAELHIHTVSARLFGKTKIPAFSVDTQTGLDLTDSDRALNPMPTLDAITPSQADQVSWVHVTAYGWLLIPRGWSVVDGGVGADGSMALVASNKNGSSWLQYTDMGACVGCAVGAASCFFPQAQKYALELEMGQCKNTKSPSLAARRHGKESLQSARSASLQYTNSSVNGAYEQVLRRYLDDDGYIRFRQLTLHSMDGKKTDMRAEGLGLFFTQVWAPGK